MIEVIALDTYEKLNIRDTKEEAIIKKGTKFKVDRDRLNILLGNNKYNEPFVKLKETKQTKKKK